MSLHASNARQCFKTRLHTDLQQITGAVRCPFMLQTLVNASKPVFTQIFNRSLEQCDVPSCFKRSPMLQNPSSHRSSTDHWSSAMSLHASNARQCFKTRLHTDLQQITGAVRCPFMLQTLVNASKPVFTQIFNRSLEQCDVPSCFKRSPMLQNPSSHRSSHRSLEQCDVPSCFKRSSMLQNPSSHKSSTGHWSSAMSLHASNARQCFKTRLHTDLQQITGAVRCPLCFKRSSMLQNPSSHRSSTGHWSSAMSLHASNAHQCFKTRLHTDLQQITGAVRCPFMLQTLVNASKPVFTQIFNRSLEQCDVPSRFKRSPMLQNPSSHRSSHRSLEQFDVPLCFKRSPMLQNPSSHRSSHRSLEQCDVPSCFKRSSMLQNPSSHRSSHRSLEQFDVPSCLKHSPMLQNPSSHRSSHRSLEQFDVPSCLKHSPMLQNPSSHRSSHRSLEQFDVPSCLKHSPMLQNPSSHRSSTDHWSSSMSLHASNARQCFKTRLHTDLQQITGAVRCPFMLQTLVNASKPVFTQIFNRSLEQCDVPSCFKRSSMLQNPSSHRSSTDHWSSSMSLHASNARQCFKTRLHTDLQQITGAVRCPFMLQTLVNASKPVFTQIFNRSLEQCDVPSCLKHSPMLQNLSSHRSSHRSLEQCDVPSCLKHSPMLQNPSSHRSSHRSLEQFDVPLCFKRSSMLQNPSSHRSSTDHWSSAMSLHASNARQCFKTRLHTDLHTDHWSSAMSLHASNAHQCFKTRLHTDLQQITGAVRCPLVFEALHHHPRPKETQDNRT